MDFELLEQHYAATYAVQAQRVLCIGTRQNMAVPYQAAKSVLVIDALASALPLPVEKESIDALCVQRDVLQVDLLWFFIPEMLRVLSPTGTALLIVPSPPSAMAGEQAAAMLADVLAAQETACRLLEWFELTGHSGTVVLVIGPPGAVGRLAPYYPDAHLMWSAPLLTVRGASLRCNLCGGQRFLPGPGGRIASNGRPPRCQECGSLERHRVVQKVLAALQAGFLGERSLLLVGDTTGVPTAWFGSVDRVSLEDVAAAQIPHHYGAVIACHVLGFVRDDRAAFDRLLDTLLADGWLMCVFPDALEQDISIDVEHPPLFHRYGRDVIARFDCMGSELHVLEIEMRDPGSGVQMAAHIYTREPRIVRQMQRWLGMDEGFRVRAQMQPERRGATAKDPFSPLRAELELWQASGRSCPFWWRDDDLVCASPELNKMALLAAEARVPVLAAVIPAHTDGRLGEDTMGMAELSFCQHGYAHKSHVAAGVPSSEFGNGRQLSEVAREIAEGRQRLQGLFGERFIPVFVPPWNRIAANFIPLLEEYRFLGLSQHRDEPSLPDSKLITVHCDIEILLWSAASKATCKPTQTLVLELVKRLAKLRTNAMEPEPLGVLTHHRAMKDDAWLFMHTLFAVTAEFSVVRWLPAAEIFSTVRKGVA
ncbi:MAG: hypothetical protein EKK49_12960 [Rhodocyclaceae bacterium]|nr:MAG: hypothetical protein EKK49_12960 [Rhodocyclaceae bacterium]